VIVVDASAAVDLLIRRQPQAGWVDERLRADDDLHAPHMIDIETANGIRRLTLRGLVSRSSARSLLRELADLRLIRYGHALLLDRIWQLWPAMTPADAAYVALAERLGATLITTDERLGRTQGHRARILAYQQQV